MALFVGSDQLKREKEIRLIVLWMGIMDEDSLV
jgi:hypothetical protein